MADVKEPTEVAGEKIPVLEFSKSLRIFDYFHFFNMAAFLVRPGRGDPGVLQGDDHGACFTDCRLTDFESYVETVLAHRGAIHSRKSVFGERWGSNGEPLVRGAAYWKKKRVTLDRVLEAESKE